ncbi:MAG: SNF2-related protein [Hydrogeniiclostridium mannosilyticum]
MLPAYASSNIEIYPYQIAAALFALRSPHLKGTVLCDEGSLGKTYEALLVATQMRYEGKDRQLLILPTNLIHQWAAKIESGFSLPFCILDSEEALRTCVEDELEPNPFERQELVVTTYDFAVERAGLIRNIQWDLVIFDEASCLSKGYTGQNKTASTSRMRPPGLIGCC